MCCNSWVISFFQLGNIMVTPNITLYNLFLVLVLSWKPKATAIDTSPGGTNILLKGKTKFKDGQTENYTKMNT